VGWGKGADVENDHVDEQIEQKDNERKKELDCTALACELAEGGRDGRAGRAGCPIRVRDPVSTLALRMAVQQQ
jgi:hypothetical protein